MLQPGLLDLHTQSIRAEHTISILWYNYYSKKEAPVLTCWFYSKFVVLIGGELISAVLCRTEKTELAVA